MLVHDTLLLNAHRTPDKPALKQGGTTRTFGELRDNALRLATALVKLTEPGDRVALLSRNRIEYVEALYGVPAAGTALTLLNYRLHPREWVWILNNASAKVLIVEPELWESLEPYRAELDVDPEVVLLGQGYDELLAGAVPSDAPRQVSPDDVAWLIYTSGTTGRPKGAMLSHTNLCASVTQSVIEYHASGDVVFLNAMPLCHVAGYLMLVYLYRGGSTVLMRDWDPEEWLDTIDREAVTNVALAPTMLATAMDHPSFDSHRLDSLRWVGYGASKINPTLLRRVIDRFGPIVSASMGMTETSGAILTLDEASHARAANGEPHLLDAAGTPMSAVDVRIFDPEGRECPPGAVGEIVVRGDQVCLGYLGSPEATAEATRDGWFHTGDAGRRDEEGYIYIVDRIKDMVISGGENVYSTEVENVIYTHPGVAEVAVIGTPDPKWGELVTAVIVPRPGTTVTEESVTALCRDHLAGYKVPRIIRFADDLPKTASGKILKHQLRTPAPQAAPLG